MTGNHASDGAGLFEGASETGLAPWDGYTIAIPQIPAAATEPFTPDWTQPQPAAIETPAASPEPEPDIPLDKLPEWVEACIEEAGRAAEAARGRAEESSAAFELSLDAHTATARQDITEHAANWAETIISRCNQAMHDPKTAPSPRERAA